MNISSRSVIGRWMLLQRLTNLKATTNIVNGCLLKHTRTLVSVVSPTEPMLQCCKAFACTARCEHTKTLDLDNGANLQAYLNGLTHREADIEAEKILNSLNAEQAQKLKVIQLEHDIWKQLGHKVPENVKPSWWVHLLTSGTKTARKKRHSYYWSLESVRKKEEMKKAIRAEERKEKKRDEENRFQKPKNTLFMRVRESTMNHFRENRMIQAMRFGQDLVIDLDFEGMMRPVEHMKVSKQLIDSYGYNRKDMEPFHMVFTGAHPQNPTVMCMNKFCGSGGMDNIVVTRSEKSYLDLYPRNRLVYLTPNAPNILENYDHDAVYIIGGYVDQWKPEPVTKAKAKEQRIRMARLPIDHYLVWSQGTKNLTVDQMLRIMLDLKSTNDWNIALQHVPKRKLLQHSDMVENSKPKKFMKIRRQI